MICSSYCNGTLHISFKKSIDERKNQEILNKSNYHEQHNTFLEMGTLRIKTDNNVLKKGKKLKLLLKRKNEKGRKNNERKRNKSRTIQCILLFSQVWYLNTTVAVYKTFHDEKCF